MPSRRLLPGELHTSSRPSLTAQIVTFWRAEEFERSPSDRIVSDEFASLFLPERTAAALPWSRRLRPLRDLAARTEIAGLGTYVLCRHRFIDEHLLAALDAGAEQVLVLGAGFDSRAYRFADELDGRPVFEVDLPALSRLKAGIVERHRDRFGPTQVRRVEIDFRTQILRTQLDLAGFRRGARTVVIWEGVTYYLDRPAVLGTLDDLLQLCGPGSSVALDLWDTGGGAGPLAPLRRVGAAALELVGEPITFGLSPTQVPAFAERQGYAVTDLAESDELDARYATLGRRCFRGVYTATLRR